MHVSITDKCQGHARCLALAPEIFYVDDAGYGAVHGDGNFPDEKADLIQQALINCPENAIRVRRGAGT
jgi:ferredoxin